MDVGTTLVDSVYSIMQIDDDWSVRGERGFTWWAGDLRQDIWAEPSFDDYGEELVRVHARTEIARDVAVDPGSEFGLSSLGIFASLSGLVYEEHAKALSLSSSVYAHEQNLQWIGPLLSLSAAIQVSDAHHKAGDLAESFGWSLAVSQHPQSGRRAEPDEMADFSHFLPGRDEPSRYDAENFAEAEMHLRPFALVATFSETGLTAEFPWPDDSCLLEVSSREHHPELGSGVHMLLTLPLTLEKEEVFHKAVALNALESNSLTRCPFTGSWCPEVTKLKTPLLAFTSFIPNLVYQPSLLPNLCIYMAHRARWAAELLTGVKYADYAKTARPAIASLLPSDLADGSDGSTV
jgi:hypothetical protein